MKLIILLFFGIPQLLFCAEICVTIVVKNDEAVIENCLLSVQEIADCVVICDIGSTDNTLLLVQQFMHTTGIPGKIYRHTWKNYGYNRSLAVEAAVETLKENRFNLSSTYLLMLDSDMLVHPGESFNKDLLNKDAFLVLEKSSGLSCYNYNLKFLKASLPWQSFGVAHEYWSPNCAYQCEKLSNFMIEAMGDQQAKTKQNIDLIQEGLQKEPENERYMFYLAQSLKSLKKFTEAITWYKKRIARQGDKEEIWFSKYMLGECYKELGVWDTALFWYLEAYQYNPDRTDSLLNVATYYRMNGQNDLAFIFTSYGIQIPRKEEQIFFNSSPEENYRFDEEMSIAAYYTRFKDVGFNAADNLLLKRGVPWHVKDQTYKNLLFYVSPLPNARFLPIAIDFPLIKSDSHERYHPMNPSIAKTAQGYKVICRTVNYTQTGAKFFHTIDDDGVFRTRNFLVYYNKLFHPLSQTEISENTERKRIQSWRSNNVKGLEDCRIFDFRGRTWFTCTTSDTNANGDPQISLCRLNTSETGAVDKFIPLLGPDPNRCEKNWLPFIRDDVLLTIYSYDPFIIYRPDLATGKCETVVNYKPQLDLSCFRGSAGPIEWNEGYLMLVHEVVYMNDHTRRYLHRFVFLDQNFMIQKFSKPFIFNHVGIEFCTSMTLDHSGKELILAVGIEDSQALLCFVTVDTIQSLLQR
jgi:glycosyltransferase involved in cell wall biosynthesis